MLYSSLINTYQHHHEIFNSDVIYGIISSRRLEQSLGLNFFSNTIKGCNFNCTYCQYGRTYFTKESFLNKSLIMDEIEKAIIVLKINNFKINSITLAGNGEPTIHPDFNEIIDFILNIRNKELPNVPISLFTNATMLNHNAIQKRLSLVENNFIKIDGVDQDSFKKMGGKGSFEEIIKDIQSMSKLFPITISTAVIKEPSVYSNFEYLKTEKFANLINSIEPQCLHLYSINKPPAEIEIQRIGLEDLKELKRFLAKYIKCPVKILA